MNNLLEIKKNTIEANEIKPIQALQLYFEEKIKELDIYLKNIPEKENDWSILNQLFLDELEK